MTPVERIEKLEWLLKNKNKSVGHELALGVDALEALPALLAIVRTAITYIDAPTHVRGGVFRDLCESVTKLGDTP